MFSKYNPQKLFRLRIPDKSIQPHYVCCVLFTHLALPTGFIPLVYFIPFMNSFACNVITTYAHPLILALAAFVKRWVCIKVRFVAIFIGFLARRFCTFLLSFTNDYLQKLFIFRRIRWFRPDLSRKKCFWGDLFGVLCSDLSICSQFVALLVFIWGGKVYGIIWYEMVLWVCFIWNENRGGGM